MKHFVSLLLFNLLCLVGFSQSNIRLNNYWENTYYINPASINSEYQFMASGAARKQWIGFPGAPATEFITFTSRFYTNKTQETQVGQIGLKVFHDKIGYSTQINISPSFSYSLRMFNDWRVNLGVAYKIQSMTYDLSMSIPEIKPDPALGTIETKWGGHNADLGAELVGNRFLAGLASQNLMSLFSNDNSFQTNSTYLYGMYRNDVDNFFNLLLGACAIKNENIYQGEFNISGILTSKNLPVFQLGVFYRTTREIGFLFGVDFSSSVRLACSYDYHIGDISHSSFGTPEILLIWKFGKLENCDCKGIFR